MVECTEEITLADLHALFYYTGWGTLWKTDNPLSDQAGDWVVDKKVILVGADNWAVELSRTGPDPICAEPPESDIAAV